MSSDTPLRVVRLRVSDFKRLRVVDVEPPPGAVVVAGRNAQGKSSILDAILAAFGGKRLCPPKPVRIGAERAEILVDLGEIEVYRTFEPGGETRVRVRAKDGAEYGKAQATLDALAGPFLDPLAFTRLKPAERKRALLELLDLGDFDLDASEARERGVREDRTLANRELKRLQAERDGIALPPDLPPVAPDVGAAVRALEEATAEMGRIAAIRQRAETAADRVPAARDHVAKIESIGVRRVEEAAAALARAKREAIEAKNVAEANLVDAEAQAAKLAGEVAGAVEPDLHAARAAVEAAREVEAQVRQRERWRVLDARAEEIEAQAKALDAKIAAEKAAREAALSKAPVPVDGLEVGEDDAYYRGVPFEQAAQSEQIRVATRLAMARDQRLHVLRIQDGALLDPEHLALVREEASEAGWQLWIEALDPAGADLVIEDGTVVPPTEPANGVEQPAASKKRGAKKKEAKT